MTSPTPTTAKPRARKLKVYGGNLDGTHRAIMACYSFKEFRAATRISPEYGCETGNANEIAQAIKEPGTVFIRKDMQYPLPAWQVHKRSINHAE